MRVDRSSGERGFLLRQRPNTNQNKRGCSYRVMVLQSYVMAYGGAYDPLDGVDQKRGVVEIYALREKAMRKRKKVTSYGKKKGHTTQER